MYLRFFKCINVWIFRRYNACRQGIVSLPYWEILSIPYEKEKTKSVTTF